MEITEEQLSEFVDELMKIQREFGYELAGVQTKRKERVRQRLEIFVAEVQGNEDSEDNA